MEERDHPTWVTVALKENNVGSSSVIYSDLPTVKIVYIFYINATDTHIGCFCSFIQSPSQGLSRLKFVGPPRLVSR